MADFLLELYSEEIPASMQKEATIQLERLMVNILKQYGIAGVKIVTYFSAQRLALLMEELPLKITGQKIEKKGPRFDAPQKAIDGFLHANGLENTDILKIKEDAKGAFYVLDMSQDEQDLSDIFQAECPRMIKNFKWPKSMRWGKGDLYWIRPLRSILCRFNEAVIPFQLEGLTAQGFTYGHRFLSPSKIDIKANADYVPLLKDNHVIINVEERKKLILEQAEKLAQNANYMLVKDDALLEEVAGLVEYPVCLIGAFDPFFMDIPSEVLQMVMRVHQKYFSVQDPKTGQLVPWFIVVSNMKTKDKGQAIIEGNERVLQARLADAKFFWEQDQKKPLTERLPDLQSLIFSKDMPMLWICQEMEQRYKSSRGKFGERTEVCEKAIKYAKADLTTSMVIEFPKLEGIMGAYYVKKSRLGEDVSQAIKEHYAPRGKADKIPSTCEGCVVALVDKAVRLDHLVQMHGYPTGSGDRYGLRRLALGMIRILIERGISVDIEALFDRVNHENLFKFILMRLKIYLEEDKKVRADVIKAYFSRKNASNYNIHLCYQNICVLEDFIQKPAGISLLVAFHRTHNLVQESVGEIAPKILQETAEKDLYEAIKKFNEKTGDVLSMEDFEKHLTDVSKLCVFIHKFFDDVMIMDNDEAVKNNRLGLLSRFLDIAKQFADFEHIEKKK